MMSPMTLAEPGSRPTSPSASRWRRPSWRDPRLAFGVLLVLLSVVVGARLLGQPQAGVKVWAADVDLSPGQTLASSQLRAVVVTFPDQQAADRYLPASSPVPARTTLNRAVGAGELLPRSAVSSGEGRGLVEVPLAVGADALPHALTVGSVVDVWVAPAPGQAAGSSAAVRVLHDVPVLSLVRDDNALAPTGTRQVVVGVDQSQASALDTALARIATGQVVLTRTAP